MLSYKLYSLGISLLLTIPVFSQQLNDTLLLKSFEIEATRNSVHQSFKNQVLDSTVLERNNTASLAQLLEENTAVFVKNYGAGSIASVSFRGTGASHTQVYWNGIAMNSPVLGEVDFSLFPVGFSNNIEIHHGLSSLADGTGGLGGSIQLNSTANWQNENSGFVQLQYGSFGLFNTLAGVGFGKKNWRHQTNVLYQRAENNFEFLDNSSEKMDSKTMENAHFQKEGIIHNSFYKSGKNEVKVCANYIHNYRGLPNPIVVKTIANETLKDIQLRAMAEWKHIFKKGFTSVKGAFLTERLNYIAPQKDIDSKYTTSTGQVQLKGIRYFGNNTHLKSMVDFRYDEATNTNYKNVSSFFTISPMVSLTQKIKRVELVGLVREEIRNGSFSKVLPSVGAVADITKWLNFKANYAHSYRLPSMNELYWDDNTTKGNPNLVPETGRSVESGIVLSNKNEETMTSMEVTGFYSRVNNWILWAPDSSSGNAFTPQNIRKVENKGVEVDLKSMFKMGQLSVAPNAIYSFTSTQNLVASSVFDLSKNKQLIYVPFHQTKLNLAIGFKNADVVYSHLIIGKRFITTDNNWFMPSYNTGNLSVNYRLVVLDKLNVQTGFSVRNIWNTQYQSIAWRPMPGRNYLVTLKMKI